MPRMAFYLKRPHTIMSSSDPGYDLLSVIYYFALNIYRAAIYIQGFKRKIAEAAFFGVATFRVKRDMIFVFSSHMSIHKPFIKILVFYFFMKGALFSKIHRPCCKSDQLIPARF